jgi:hypothetical protein
MGLCLQVPVAEIRVPGPGSRRHEDERQLELEAGVS